MDGEEGEKFSGKLAIISVVRRIVPCVSRQFVTKNISPSFFKFFSPPIFSRMHLPPPVNEVDAPGLVGLVSARLPSSIFTRDSRMLRAS